jgi:hypothetical protein
MLHLPSSFSSSSIFRQQQQQHLCPALETSYRPSTFKHTLKTNKAHMLPLNSSPSPPRHTVSSKARALYSRIVLPSHIPRTPPSNFSPQDVFVLIHPSQVLTLTHPPSSDSFFIYPIYMSLPHLFLHLSSLVCDPTPHLFAIYFFSFSLTTRHYRTRSIHLHCSLANPPFVRFFF